ncbi:hypothetical protein ACFL60_06600, partial [Candidatus Omnitrophota bacterium]
DIGGAPADKSNLEEVYRKQLIKYDYGPHYLRVISRVKSGSIHSDDENYLYKITKQVNEDTKNERSAAAKARTEKRRQYNQQVKTKTTILSEASGTLTQILQAENNHYIMSQSFADFDFGEDCVAIGFAQPENANYTYAFKDGKAIAKERIDVNNDGDTNDGLTGSIIRENGVAVSLEVETLPGSNLTWEIGIKDQMIKRLGLKWK